MFDIKRQKLLRGLLTVKDVRKSLAETDYLRCSKQERQRHTDWTLQSECLERNRVALPTRQAAILRGLRIKPVGLQEIHCAHEMIASLHDTVAAMEQENTTLMSSYQQACDATKTAHLKLGQAAHQLEKFQGIKARSNAKLACGAEIREEAELEERPQAGIPFFTLTQGVA